VGADDDQAVRQYEASGPHRDTLREEGAGLINISKPPKSSSMSLS
jgi:hypothetical protein